jgi:hypothetical protein
MTDKEWADFEERLKAAIAKDDARTPEEVAAWEKYLDETLTAPPYIPGLHDDPAPDAVTAIFFKKIDSKE